MRNIINFIKYHNLFTIILAGVLLATGGAFAASPDFREGVTGALVSSETTINSIDNSQILAVDLDNFSFSLEIKAISDDEKNYYVLYSYTTIAIQDAAWNVVEKEKTLTVSKKALGERDLGLYVTEELGEVIDAALVYLSKVQNIEREKGIAKKVITTQYAGLVGRFLSPKEKVFSGYEPVVIVVKEAIVGSDPTTEPQPETGLVPEADSSTSAPEGGQAPQTDIAPPVEVVTQQLIDRELIREIVLELLAQEQDQQSLVVAPSNTEEPPVEDSVDTTPPVITLIGTSPIELTVDEIYIDEGAIAQDDIDGDITSSIITVGTINEATVGIYIITYNVSDIAGNNAVEVLRTVSVVDAIPEELPDEE